MCRCLRKEMKLCVETLHINLNRIMLLAVGLWPYQQSKLVRVQLVILLSVLTSFIIFQLSAFVTLELTVDLVIDVLSSTLIYVLTVIKYISFFINIEIVKCLLEEVQNIYNNLQDENEINILRKYGNYAKIYSATFMLTTAFLIFTSALHILWPSILNIFLPTKEARRPSLLTVTEYFIDKEKYIYLITLHEHVAFIIGAMLAIATGAILIVYLQNACGMFRITSYRLEQAMAICSLQTTSANKKHYIYKKLITAVNMHRRALQLTDSLISEFKTMFFLLIIVSIICLSLNYFRVSRIMTYEYSIENLIVPMMFIFIQLSYLSISCYIAQEITDYNNDVFMTVYNIQWYLAPLHTQKMILFLLQKGRNAFQLSCGGIFVGSLETAASLVGTSISYFTVLYSTRK